MSSSTSSSSSYQPLVLLEEESKNTKTTFAMTREDVIFDFFNNDDPSTNVCLASTFCPCLVLREITQNIGLNEPFPTLFCLTSYPLFMAFKAMIGHPTAFADPCSTLNLAFLGSVVAHRRGITDHTMKKSCLYSMCNVCTCYMCRVLHESRLYREERMMDSIHKEEVMERGDEKDNDEGKENGEYQLYDEDRKQDDPLIVIYG